MGKTRQRATQKTPERLHKLRQEKDVLLSRTAGCGGRGGGCSGGKQQFVFRQIFQVFKKEGGKERNKTRVLLARLGSLVGLAMPGSIPRTSGGSIGFPKYKLEAKDSS